MSQVEIEELQREVWTESIPPTKIHIVNISKTKLKWKNAEDRKIKQNLEVISRSKRKALPMDVYLVFIWCVLTRLELVV